jgi:hypothetical protein
LRAHRRIYIGIAASNAIAGLPGNGCNAAHEGAANAKNVDVCRPAQIIIVCAMRAEIRLVFRE